MGLSYMDLHGNKRNSDINHRECTLRGCRVWTEGYKASIATRCIRKANHHQRRAEASQKERKKKGVVREKRTKAVARERKAKTVRNEKKAKAVARERGAKGARERKAKAVRNEKKSKIVARERGAKGARERKTKGVVLERKGKAALENKNKALARERKAKKKVIALTRCPRSGVHCKCGFNTVTYKYKGRKCTKRKCNTCYRHRMVKNCIALKVYATLAKKKIAHEKNIGVLGTLLKMMSMKSKLSPMRQYLTAMKSLRPKARGLVKYFLRHIHHEMVSTKKGVLNVWGNGVQINSKRALGLKHGFKAISNMKVDLAAFIKGTAAMNSKIKKSHKIPKKRMSPDAARSLFKAFSKWKGD